MLESLKCCERHRNVPIAILIGSGIYFAVLGLGFENIIPLIAALSIGLLIVFLLMFYVVLSFK